MKKTTAKLDLDVLRGLAKSRAMLLAENSGIDPDTVRCMIDTICNKQCFVVSEDETRAIVVYENNPETKFNIINRPGRLQPLSAEQP